MGNLPSKLVFAVIVLITVFSGIGAAALAIFEVSNSAPSANITSLFGTLTHVFTGGVGAIFGLMAAR